MKKRQKKDNQKNREINFLKPRDTALEKDKFKTRLTISKIKIKIKI